MKTTSAKSTILPSELHALLSGGCAAELLDVRTPGEHAACHVPGTKLVPLGDLDAAGYLRQRADAGRPLYVLCQSGGRAAKAVEQFRAAGFDGCVLVEGGTQAWVDAGLPVNRGTGGGIPLMRQVQIVVGFVAATGSALAVVVDSRFAVLPLVMGCGLLFAGLSGTCMLATLLAKMPWNRAPGCASKSCCTN